MYPPHIIEDDFGLTSQTFSDWSRFCRNWTLYYFEKNMMSQIESKGNTVEIGKLNENGFDHEENFVEPFQAEVRTENIENMWLVHKLFLAKVTHRAPQEYEYIFEYFFRWQNQNIL
ncbi:hypothetical protein RF11_05123 [Thelohanellus kitauei]|uniref:Uncharacterized protein n=1 Tax=Thelohanellus kitauei TaxID=669202 RepID=A0A0C2IH55_THEKT|nr:hypothetical protein RF11_05123 [Thelohanellus kitauei]